MPLSTWDIDGCCCCPCYPCTLPARDLSYTASGTILSGTQSGALTYLGACEWGVCLNGFGGSSYYFFINCNIGGAYVLQRWTDATCGNSGGFRGPDVTLLVCTAVCAPLNLILKHACTGANIVTITITP